MNLELVLVLGILIAAAGTGFSLLIWVIQLFANRKKSLTTGKVVLCFWAALVLLFLGFAWVPDADMDFSTNIIGSIFVLIMASAMSLIVIIPMAIVSCLEKKKAKREEEFFADSTPYVPKPQPITTQHAYNHPKPTPKPAPTYTRPESPTFTQPETRPVHTPEPTPKIQSAERRVVASDSKTSVSKPVESTQQGKDTIYKILAHRESSGTKFLFNVQLPNSEETIDVIMLDSYGIFVFKVAQQENAQEAVLQNTKCIKTLQPYITIRGIPFHNVVCVKNINTQRETMNNPYVVSLPGLQDKIKELCYQHSLCLLSSDINQVYQNLLPYASK